MQHSALYFGTVSHVRRAPVEHRFSYRLWMAYLDLAELPALVGQGKLLSDRWFAPASLLRGDHSGDPALPLDEAYRQCVQTQTGRRPSGPIRLLTLLRHWGYFFSPLNLAYCFDPTGQQVDYVVAEVSNTPWHERHCYVLWSGNADFSVSAESPRAETFARFAHPKSFHVSPFMGMQASYHWKVSPPGERLAVSISSEQGGQFFFQAALAMQRKPLDRANLRRALVVNPCVPAKVMGSIYYQALRLWMKKAPYFPHPTSGRDD
jgi:DUF1365 family protein